MKPIPKFKTAEEAALFWENHEILDYVDPDEFEPVSSQAIKKQIMAAGGPKRPQQAYFSVLLNQGLLGKALKQSKASQLSVDEVIQRWVKKGSKEAL